MRICYLATIESIHTRRWLEYFRNKGHEVHIITFAPGEMDGISVHYFEQPKSRHPLSKLYFFLSTFHKVRQTISKINPDVLHAHKALGYGLFAVASGFKPAIVSCWGSDVLSLPSKSIIFKMLARYILKKASAVTVVANHMIPTVVRLGADVQKVFKISLGIDGNMFNINVGKKVERVDVPVILSMRAFEREHNVGLFINAIPFVINHIPDARILIIGSGSQEQMLKQTAESLGIIKNIEFLGTVPHEYISNYLGIADLYISTSLSDGDHISLIEALACGIFPVVTDIPANREWITDGKNGFLVPTDDPQFLATKIVEAINNTELRKFAFKYNSELAKSRAATGKDIRRIEDYYSKWAEIKVRREKNENNIS